jgi:hypothetical protein
MKKFHASTAQYRFSAQNLQNGYFTLKIPKFQKIISDIALIFKILILNIEFGIGICDPKIHETKISAS